MHSSLSERRSNPRSQIQFPVLISGADIAPDARGVTRDVSREGIYFYSDAAVTLGQEIVFKMLMPAPEGTTSTRALCSGTVIRVETGSRAAMQDYGVAVRINSIKLG